MIRKFIVKFGILILLQGCATPFAQFYYDQTGGVDLSKLPSVVLPTGEPQVYRGNDQDQDTLKMLEDNYSMIGYSLFNAANIDENGAVTQAKKVNASFVILYSKYTGSTNGSVPLVLPDTKTSSTSLQGSAYGSGGYASYSGTAYTTTYGTKTTYIPYTVHRSDYLATYWIKMKSPIFGIHIGDITPEIKKRIGSNKGLLVFAVIKGSPAFEADILKGNVLRKIADISVYDQESFQRALSKYEGKEIIVTIFRDEKEIVKSVKLRSGG